jgi:DNA-binding response OmpR family regulator
MKILYVENHATFAANVMRVFLSSHLVTVVPSLAKAREVLLNQPFDLLLVDYDLDDGKGDELVSELRAANIKTPIIGVSSHDEGNRMLLKSGASATCNKMNFDEIEKVIEKIISQ